MNESEVDNSLPLEKYGEKIKEFNYQDLLGDEILYNMNRLKVSLEELQGEIPEEEGGIIIDELIEILEESKKDIPHT